MNLIAISSFSSDQSIMKVLLVISYTKRQKSNEKSNEMLLIRWDFINFVIRSPYYHRKSCLSWITIIA